MQAGVPPAACSNVLWRPNATGVLALQLYIGLALALFECVPMGAIGMYFLISKYSIPTFQIVSLFSSALLLGMKVSALSTLPYWWAKLKKWRATELPVAVESREVEMTPVDHAHSSSDSSDSAAGEAGVPPVCESLRELRAHTLAVAEMAERYTTRSNRSSMTKVEMLLMKMAHHLSQSIKAAHAADDPPPPVRVSATSHRCTRR